MGVDLLAVTGHRPDKLGGYGFWSNGSLREAVTESLLGLSPQLVLSGMALGIDQLVVAICLEYQIPYVAVVPFPGQDSLWPPSARAKYGEFLSKALSVETLHPEPYEAWKMTSRNQWMVNRADHLLAVWDGSRGGTRDCVERARKAKLPITRINPQEHIQIKPEHQIAFMETFGEAEYRLGELVHVEGWARGCVFVYQGTENGTHKLVSPSKGRPYTTQNRLLKTRRKCL